MTNDPITLEDEQRTRCEVWTRVMGYHRLVHAFNAGKQAEHSERQPFSARQEGYRFADGAWDD